MERCCLIVWILMVYLAVGVLPQYRDKNMSISDSDAVQTLLARYLQRRLQSSSQISTPPPPSVIFSLAQQNQRSKSRQAAQTNNISPLHSLEEEDTDDRQRNERRERRYEYDDYEDDLEGFEDSDKSRTRINLLAGNDKEYLFIGLPSGNRNACEFHRTFKYHETHKFMNEKDPTPSNGSHGPRYLTTSNLF